MPNDIIMVEIYSLI